MTPDQGIYVYNTRIEPGMKYKTLEKQGRYRRNQTPLRERNEKRKQSKSPRREKHIRFKIHETSPEREHRSRKEERPQKREK